ncbi:hypothetical protein, partial [Arthrobacter tecti]
AKKPATPQSEATSKSTNQKTIGINKHGTLLSSQTTEAIHIIRNSYLHFRAALLLNLIHPNSFCQIGRQAGIR